MPRTRSIAWAELKLGVIGIVALVLIALTVVALGGSGGFWWQRYPLKAILSDAAGLKPGAVVRVAGKEIGTVTSVEFAGPRIEVAFEISKDVRQLVTTDSVASVGSLSLLGEPMIDITAASTGQSVPDWGYVKTTGKGSFGDLTTSASESLEIAGKILADIRAGRGTVGKLFTDEALYRDLDQFVSAASDVTRAIKGGKGTLGALVNDPSAHRALQASLENLQTITARITTGQGALARLVNDEAMSKSLATTTASLAATTANLEQVSGRLNRGEGTMGKLLNDDQLYSRLNGMATKVEQLVANIEAGQGTAGKLLKDQQLYDNMNRAMTELRDLFTEIRKDPKKYLTVRVSIF